MCLRMPWNALMNHMKNKFITCYPILLPVSPLLPYFPQYLYYSLCGSSIPRLRHRPIYLIILKQIQCSFDDISFLFNFVPCAFMPFLLGAFFFIILFCLFAESISSIPSPLNRNALILDFSICYNV